MADYTPEDLEDIRIAGEQDMVTRELREHQIEGKVFECPHCGSPAYLMPMALITYEPRWMITVTVTCPRCGRDVYVDIS